ncbi:MAG: hypothetical protein KA164_06140 [Rhodoferax sp.]|nr:hypothetical protein [Rhodoferax sp.]
MSQAEQIRAALARVAQLRDAARAQPALRQALETLKGFQSRRFAATYADLAADQVHGPATAFFLEELYGGRDYPERDGQFARVARTLEQTFPADVLATAVEVAQLHALSEELDHAMAQAWLARMGDRLRPGALLDAATYVALWRSVGRREDRLWQLQTVLALGQTLSRLTRKKALGWMLRMMHGPAKAAGLADLQRFLSLGFDTFGLMATQPGAAVVFLDTIGQREAAWIKALFDDEARRVEQALVHLLQAGR